MAQHPPVPWSPPSPAANTNLGTEFQRCANRAQARSSVRRDQSLAALSTADGRRVTFSKAARSRIPKEVIELIR